MEVWKIIFLSKWVICRFQPSIFQGVLDRYLGVHPPNPTGLTGASPGQTWGRGGTLSQCLEKLLGWPGWDSPQESFNVAVDVPGRKWMDQWWSDQWVRYHPNISHLFISRWHSRLILTIDPNFRPGTSKWGGFWVALLFSRWQQFTRHGCLE